MVHLNNIWFVIIAIFWVGFFVLEGFDFGVGMLHSFVGQDDVERRIAVNSIGPIWDGNEVWLVVAGAAIFAAFPSWYATMFSTFYLALLIVLVALIVRGVSFEFHRKIDNPRWRATWRWSLTIGSAAHPPAARHRPRRPPPRAAHQLGPQLHRQLLRAAGPLRALHRRHPDRAVPVPRGRLPHPQDRGRTARRVARLSGRLGWLAAVVTFGWLTWSHVGLGVGLRPQPDRRPGPGGGGRRRLAGRGPARGLGVHRRRRGHRQRGRLDLLRAVPRVMVSSTNSAYNLTVANSASPSYTLKVMTVVAVIFFPLVLAYQGWSLYVFRKRISGGPPSVVAAPVEPDVPPPTPRETPVARGRRVAVQDRSQRRRRR